LSALKRLEVVEKCSEVRSACRFPIIQTQNRRSLSDGQGIRLYHPNGIGLLS
jgi:hypothetical protein